jgi:AcrR family transcriptional regulator
MESALRLFDERGFHGATLDEIAIDAGVNRGTVYLHFKNKAEIVLALEEDLDLDCSLHYDAMRRATTRAELERAFDDLLGYWLKRLSPVYRHGRDAARVDDELAQRGERDFEWGVTTMKEILMSHGVDETSAHARAFALTAMFPQMIERLRGGMPYGIRRMALRDALVDLFEAARTPASA